MNFSFNRSDFCKSRAPKELAEYFEKNYQQIKSDKSIVNQARLKKEPYKTFIEELMPFSIFCTERLDQKNKVYCYLTEENEKYDAIINDNGRQIKVQITWPTKGKEDIEESKLLNYRGLGTATTWDYNDTRFYDPLIKEIKSTAVKKARNDYSYKSGSILLIVIDEWLFDLSNQTHIEILQGIQENLSTLSFQAQEVCLLFLKSKKIIRIQGKPAV